MTQEWSIGRILAHQPRQNVTFGNVPRVYDYVTGVNGQTVQTRIKGRLGSTFFKTRARPPHRSLELKVEGADLGRSISIQPIWIGIEEVWAENKTAGAK